jgi:hypothetical protein
LGDVIPCGLVDDCHRFGGSSYTAILPVDNFNRFGGSSYTAILSLFSPLLKRRRNQASPKHWRQAFSNHWQPDFSESLILVPIYPNT